MTSNDIHFLQNICYKISTDQSNFVVSIVPNHTKYYLLNITLAHYNQATIRMFKTILKITSIGLQITTVYLLYKLQKQNKEEHQITEDNESLEWNQILYSLYIYIYIADIDRNILLFLITSRDHFMFKRNANRTELSTLVNAKTTRILRVMSQTQMDQEKKINEEKLKTNEIQINLFSDSQDPNSDP